MTSHPSHKAIDVRTFRKAMAFLSENDPVMATLIDRYGDKPFPTPMGAMPSMIRAVVAQQISNRAAKTLWERLKTFLGEECDWSRKLTDTSLEELRALGLNERKATTLKTIAKHFETGLWSEEKFSQMTDQEVSDAVQSLRGMGPWSAASVLIFGLGRADILPLGDFGVRVAICKLYFPDETPATLGRREGKTRVKSIECTWEPYRTVATWFLWCSLENSD